MKKVLLAVAFCVGISFCEFVSAADNSEIIDNLLKKDNTDDPFASFNKTVKEESDALSANKSVANNKAAFNKAKTEAIQKKIDDAIKARESKYNSIKTDLDAKIAKFDDSVKNYTSQIEKNKAIGGDTSALGNMLKQAQDDQAKYQDALKKLEDYYIRATDADSKKGDAKKKK